MTPAEHLARRVAEQAHAGQVDKAGESPMFSDARYDVWADDILGLISRCRDCGDLIYSADEPIHDEQQHALLGEPALAAPVGDDREEEK